MYFAISFHVICNVLFILQYTKVLKEFLTQIIESNKTHNNMGCHEGCKRGEKRYGNWNFALWFYF